MDDYIPGGWLLTIMGSFGLLLFLLLPRLQKFVSESRLLQIGISSSLMGFFILCFDDINVNWFILALAYIWSVGNPLTQTLVVSILSQSIPDKQSVSKWMGAVTAAGSVGRILMPSLSGIIMQIDQEVSTTAVLPVVAAFTCELLCLAAFEWKHFQAVCLSKTVQNREREDHEDSSQSSSTLIKL
jgi:hypothetical protein